MEKSCSLFFCPLAAAHNTLFHGSEQFSEPSASHWETSVTLLKAALHLVHTGFLPPQLARCWWEDTLRSSPAVFRVPSPHWARQQTSFYIASEKPIITSARQTEPQPPPKPGHLMFSVSFKHGKRHTCAMCIISEKAGFCHFHVHYPEKRAPFTFWMSFCVLVQRVKQHWRVQRRHSSTAGIREKKSSETIDVWERQNLPVTKK